MVCCRYIIVNTLHQGDNKIIIIIIIIITIIIIVCRIQYMAYIFLHKYMSVHISIWAMAYPGFSKGAF